VKSMYRKVNFYDLSTNSLYESNSLIYFANLTFVLLQLIAKIF